MSLCHVKLHYEVKKCVGSEVYLFGELEEDPVTVLECHYEMVWGLY